MYGSEKFRGWNQHPGFNGGGGGETKSTSTTQNYSPEEAARRTKVMDEALRVYGNTSQQIADKPYPGAAPVPFSGESLAAQNLQVQNAVNAQPMLDQVRNAQTYGLTGVMDVNNNPYLASAVQGAINPITQSFTDTGGVMSGIRDAGTNSGQFGSSRQGVAEGVAAGRYAQAIGDVSSQMYSDAYNKGQDTFTKTLALAPQTLDMYSTPVNWLSSVGAQKEDLAQQQAQYLADSGMWDINSQWAPLNNLANLIYGGGSSTATTTNTSPKAPPNRLGGAIGGAAAGTSIMPGWGTAIGAVIGALTA
jgi:hypothetical protein